MQTFRLNTDGRPHHAAVDYVRTMKQWTAAARQHGADTGQGFAQRFADQYGLAVILWADGHKTVHVDVED
jgi:hypothetical protein